MKDKKNIVWINTMKALCIVAVFFVHCQSYYGIAIGSINQFIHTFYVNAFFFVSGYLLFWKQLSAPKILEDASKYLLGGGKLLFLNVIYRVVIPSILFSMIEFFPSCIIQERSINVSFALYKTIGGGTYWFTSAFAVSELILLVLFLTRKRNIWFYSTACLVFGAVGLLIIHQKVLENNIWAWRQGLLALFFLAIGGIYWLYEKKIDTNMKWWAVVLLLLVYIFIIVFFEDTNPLISTLQIQPMGILTSCISCLLLVWFCKRLLEIKILTFIGKNSIGFYFMSGALPISLSLIAHKMTDGVHVWMMLTVWIVSLLFSYIAVMLINRWLPWLWDLRKIKN